MCRKKRANLKHLAMFSKLLFTSATLLSVTQLAAAAAGQLQQLTNFGPNPTGVQMFVYKPSKLTSPISLVIASHYCTGTAQAYFSGTQWANMADQKGFIVIYPDAPDSGGCWDVHSDATLKHDAGGDSLAIASVVRYAIQNYGVAPGQVFATGTSSGAMMTNVLAGAYPDLFRAGAAFAGVPYGCFAGSGMWNSACANGQLTKTPQQWGDQVRAGYPGYSGARPRMQLWHGTSDTTLYYNNFNEAIKQWTNVFGVSTTPTSTQANSPSSPWTKTTYGSNLVAYSGQGVSHNLPVNENEAWNFFMASITNPGNPGTPPPVSSTTPSNPSPTGQPQWAQCGGLNWTGSTTCISPFVCKYVNDWYSQCQ